MIEFLGPNLASIFRRKNCRPMTLLCKFFGGEGGSQQRLCHGCRIATRHCEVGERHRATQVLDSHGAGRRGYSIPRVFFDSCISGHGQVCVLNDATRKKPENKKSLHRRNCHIVSVVVGEGVGLTAQVDHGRLRYRVMYEQLRPCYRIKPRFGLDV